MNKTELINAAAEKAIGMVCGTVSAVRSARARFGISPKQELEVVAKAPAANII